MAESFCLFELLLQIPPAPFPRMLLLTGSKGIMPIRVLLLVCFFSRFVKYCLWPLSLVLETCLVLLFL